MMWFNKHEGGDFQEKITGGKMTDNLRPPSQPAAETKVWPKNFAEVEV